MQRRPRKTDAVKRSPPWLAALVLLTVAGLVVVSMPPSHAGGVAAGLAATGASLAGPMPSPEAVQPPEGKAGSESGQITYLPLLVHGYPTYPDSPFGVQIFGTNASLSAKLVDMGAQWVRIPLAWSTIEPENTTPENYTWPIALERQLAGLRAQGVSLILTLMMNPSWAATYPGGPVDKVNIGELVEFMEAVVTRYGAPPYRVKYWEFYNEPDNGSEEAAETGEVGFFGHQPQAYVDLLQAVYQPIKAVDPGAQIVFGGIAYDAFDDPWGGPFVRTFLDGVLENGGGDYFDVMNFHYYLAFAEEWADYGIDILGKYNYLHDKLADYGVYKPFICTETAMWSDAAHEGSHELQSRYVAQVFSRSMAAGFEFTIWFQFIDSGELGTHKWGLLDQYYEPKPAYGAYQTLARQLGAAAFVRTWTGMETGSDAVEAYEFGPGQGATWPDGTVRIVVTWTNDEEEHLLVLQADSLLRVDKFGVETLVLDGDDGQLDGLIRLPIGPSPVYLRLPE